MHQIIDIPVKSVIPSVEAILQNQGIPLGTDVNEQTGKLAREALSAYAALANPVGVLHEISRDQFEQIYRGLGRNASTTPLQDIYPRAHALALFAVTIGEAICKAIGRSFETGDYAAGAMLDAAASEGTEMLADEAQQYFHSHLEKSGQLTASEGVMPFSPGYCGWHISAQAGLFETLHPKEIGIFLNDSFLMQPLKSISGVLIAGRKEMFEFDDCFDFCGECRTRTCLDRTKALREL
jgi:hypothetical protein